MKKKRIDGPLGKPRSSPRYDRKNLPHMKPIPWERKTPKRSGA